MRFPRANYKLVNKSNARSGIGSLDSALFSLLAVACQDLWT